MLVLVVAESAEMMDKSPADACISCEIQEGKLAYQYQTEQDCIAVVIYEPVAATWQTGLCRMV